jgi:type IV secretion system protein TrbL
MKLRAILGAGLLLCLSQLASAQSSPDASTTVLTMLQQAIAPAVAKVTAHAITWLGAFSALQFCITNYNLIKSDADIQAHVAKLVGAIAWVGVCLYIIDHGPEFLRGVGDQWMSLVGVDLPSPGSIMAKTIGVTSSLAVLALGVGSIPFVGTTAGQLLLYVMFGFLFVGMYFAFKIFMLQLEVALVAMLSPLSFAFLGLSTLRDQGIAPFKALISLGYRIVLLTVLLSGYSGLSSMISDVLNNMSVDTFKNGGIGQSVETILTAMMGYLLLSFLVWKSDSIAASLASGSTSMGTGDVAQAAAAGAALGAAVATGGASTGAGLTRAPQAMADFMKRMGGGGGSISNAGPVGSGGDAPTMPTTSPPAPASLSLGSAGSSSASNARPGKASATGAGPAGGAQKAAAPASAGGAAPSSADDSSGGASKVGVTSGRYGAEPAPAPAPNASAEGQGSAPPAPPVQEPSPGSGQTAAIGGTPGTEAALNRLVDHLSSSQTLRKPTLGDRAQELGRHVSQEQAATHVSISPHHHD